MLVETLAVPRESLVAVLELTLVVDEEDDEAPPPRLCAHPATANPKTATAIVTDLSRLFMATPLIDNQTFTALTEKLLYHATPCRNKV